jgi:hypothetical protein
MSLDYDLTKVADVDTVCFYKDDTGVKRLVPLTEALIFFTIFADIGKITEKSAHEFTVRLRAYERAFEPLMKADKKRKFNYITEAQVRQHIGLVTNVFPEASRVKFERKLGRAVMHDASRMVDADKEAEKGRTRRRSYPESEPARKGI